MLTLFTALKPNHGHAAVIQRNALTSWSLLPGCETIVFGDDEGAAALAAEVGARQMPEIARNERGTPLLSDMFAQVDHLARNDLLAYVNADIILMRDFLEAAQAVRRAGWPNFLMVGKRWNVDMAQAWDFETPQWAQALRAHVEAHGALYVHWAMDYFVLPRGALGAMPPFAIGRPAWDNWMVYHARACGAPVIDATEAAMVVHQNHDYTHVGAQMDRDAVWKGAEAQHNRALAGIVGRYQLSIHNATHRLTRAGEIVPATEAAYVSQRLDSLPAYWPRAELRARVYLKILRLLARALPAAAWRGLVLRATDRVHKP
ncbi:MAG: hypothetical protein M5R40_27700 [Anaerolineae bacterium]|nr:hypothetical protein [Anaerolineae bacterium]